MYDVGEILPVETYADEVAGAEDLIFGAPTFVVEPLGLIGRGYSGVDLSSSAWKSLQERKRLVQKRDGPEVDDDATQGQLLEGLAEILERHLRIALVHVFGQRHRPVLDISSGCSGTDDEGLSKATHLADAWHVCRR